MSFLNKLIKKTDIKPETVVSTIETNNNIKPFAEGLVTTKDVIAPSAIEVDFDYLRIDNKYYRTLFVAAYPRFVGINWLSSLINFDASLNISMFIYPTDGKEILDDLRRKITEMEAEIGSDIQRGRLVNPATQAKLEDALNLQADLVKGEERFFQFGLYITITAVSVAELNRINKNLEAALGALLIISKRATLQMEDGFITTLPIGDDKLQITRNMDTTSLATTFPFVSSDLSDDKGIMYGINQHNGSLVIFDRFSMPNYNSVVFATAGAGKSYLIKLEALRSAMFGTDIIVIDPENEYRDLCESVGGQYVAFGYNENSKINPFDLSLTMEEGENALNSKMLSLHQLFKVMLGEMDPMEESILDRALLDAYKMKGITPDPETQNKEAPLVEDLYKSLIGMEDQKAANLAARLERYIKGAFAGIFNQKTTVNLTSNFVVFGIKNLEDSLRPVAMYIVLDYVWTVIKNNLKKRILIVDEAWYLMQYPDSAAFLRGVVKRGRKYYLGVTTITQDVDDFLQTPYGKEIVTNSSIQILLKQHSAAIDQLAEVFYLSEGEKQLLLSAGKGEGIFFAGQNHVAIKVIASEDEHRLITSNPEEKLKQQKTAAEPVKPIEQPIAKIEPVKPISPPINLEPKKTEEVKPSLPAQPIPVPVNENRKMFLETVVEKPQQININEAEKIENALNQRISELEVLEQKKLDEHEKQVKDEEIEKKANEIDSPKYKDLFKSFSDSDKLPPLPPLPKFEPPKPETVIPQNNNKGPVFINQTEPKIPQPPQFAKKNVPEFIDNKQNNDKKPDYDKLLGKDIV